MTPEQARQIALWREELDKVPIKRVHHRLAEALLAAGQPEEALAVAEKGLAAFTNYLACQELKGAALATMRRWPEAIAALRLVLQYIDSSTAKRWLAVAWFGAGDSATARRLCLDILKKEPLDQATRQLLAKIGAGAAAAPAPAPPPPVTIAPPKPAVPPAVPAAPVEAQRPAAESPETVLPVDDLTTTETDRLVDDFFDPLLAAEPEAVAAPPSVVAPEPAAPAPPSADMTATVEETEVEEDGRTAEEYDPTAGMEKDVDIDDIDVFGELDGQAPKASAAAEEAKTAKAKDNGDDAPADPSPAADSPPTADDSAPEKRKKPWKPWWSRKE